MQAQFYLSLSSFLLSPRNPRSGSWNHRGSPAPHRIRHNNCLCGCVWLGISYFFWYGSFEIGYDCSRMFSRILFFNLPICFVFVIKFCLIWLFDLVCEFRLCFFSLVMCRLRINFNRYAVLQMFFRRILSFLMIKFVLFKLYSILGLFCYLIWSFETQSLKIVALSGVCSVISIRSV